MRNKNFLTVLLSIFLIVSLSFGNVSIALADDASPGETPAAESTEEPADPPVIETPAPESTPESLTEESQPETEVATSADEVVETTETTADDGLLTQLPPETDVVVLDENGETVPLVTQDALDIILDTDPMWCPAGTLPGGTNSSGIACSTNFPSFGELLKDMQKYTHLYTSDGIIYFTATAIDSVNLTESALGASDFLTLKSYNLTLQGGWNGQNGADADFSGQTSFGRNTLTIGTELNPWVGSITLNNFVFSGVRSTTTTAITVYTTTGDITLSNVDVVQQTGGTYAANLDSQSGDITVENGSSFDGNNTGTNESRGFRAETGGTITITGTSSTPITFTDSRGATSNYNGATLSAPTITLNYVTANNNDLNGIEISNANLVTLNNVIANANGTDTASSDPSDLGSGILVNGTGSTIVNLSSGTFTNNERYGVEVLNGSINIVSWPTCSGNDLGCLFDPNPPTLNLPSNITVEATSGAGATATFSASATDSIDGTASISCSYVSGTVFPLGTTTVVCSSTDAHNNVATGSFTVTVVDTTAPTIQPHANIEARNNSLLGDNLSYDPPATFDIVDGTGVATCTPASGSFFDRGTTVVTCTATDSHGNSAIPITFLVRMGYVSKETPTASSQGNFVLPVTAGETIDLDCDTTVNAFGIIITFHNLCGYQSIITRVDSNALPGQLDGAMSFANGINIALLLNGEVVAELPAGGEVEVNFPISQDSGNFTALQWDNAGQGWLELPQAQPADSMNNFYQILTTESAGTIVLASK